jgi:hypothetical protein
VFLRPAIQRIRDHGSGFAACAALAVVACAALSGCAGKSNEVAKAVVDKDAASAFAVPDWVKGTSERKTTTARAITPDDLIGSDGSCAATRVAAPEPAPQPAGETDGASNNPAPAPGMAPVQPGPTVHGGIALAMTECDVAARAGYPGNVEIGSEAGGERSAVLTYRQGPWPGIYRFRGGRLVSIERVEVIEPPKPKKPARPSKPPTKVNLRNPAPQ